MNRSLSLPRTILLALVALLLPSPAAHAAKDPVDELVKSVEKLAKANKSELKFHRKEFQKALDEICFDLEDQLITPEEAGQLAALEVVSFVHRAHGAGRNTALVAKQLILSSGVPPDNGVAVIALGNVLATLSSQVEKEAKKVEKALTKFQKKLAKLGTGMARTPIRPEPTRALGANDAAADVIRTFTQSSIGVVVGVWSGETLGLTVGGTAVPQSTVAVEVSADGEVQTVQTIASPDGTFVATMDVPGTTAPFADVTLKQHQDGGSPWVADVESLAAALGN